MRRAAGFPVSYPITHWTLSLKHLLVPLLQHVDHLVKVNIFLFEQH
jgi:hypothetical protein